MLHYNYQHKSYTYITCICVVWPQKEKFWGKYGQRHFDSTGKVYSIQYSDGEKSFIATLTGVKAV